MKKITISLILGLAVAVANAQLYIGSEANSLVIKSGESFSYDGLTLTPSADLTLTNTTLTKTDANTISPAPTGTYIKRYYSFSNTTPQYAGTIRFSYSGADLNSLTAGSLQLNIRTSAAWQAVSGTDVSASSYVEATSLSITNGLNTLTLASTTGALPVTWLSFTAVKKESTSVLNWSTASEENSQDFLVQHSTTGREWNTLGTVKAAGNATTQRDYTFTHYSPMPGYNYYRLIQRDINGKYDYSRVVSVLMDKSDIKLKVFPNPVQDGKLNLIIKEPSQVILFDAMGRQVLSKWVGAGLQTLNVSSLSNGVYYVRVNNESATITINR